MRSTSNPARSPALRVAFLALSAKYAGTLTTASSIFSPKKRSASSLSDFNTKADNSSAVKFLPFSVYCLPVPIPRLKFVTHAPDSVSWRSFAVFPTTMLPSESIPTALGVR